MKEKIDYFFNKMLPKKLIVIIIASTIVFMKLEVPSEYWYLLIAYFGGNVAAKFVKGKDDV